MRAVMQSIDAASADEHEPWNIPGRVWRFFATAFAFALFGVGGLAMALVYFPILRLFVREPVRRAHLARESVHRIWRIYIEIIQAVGVLTFECEGADKLKALRGTVVVANHPTLLDVVFLMAFMRETRAVVKEGVWKNPFMSGVVSAADYIPNTGSPQKLVDDCAAALKAGANLVIFPEGSRTPPDQPRHYQRGFANAALLARAPVQIVTIDAWPTILFKGEPWWRIPARKPHWKIEVHECVDVVNQYGYHRTPATVRKLTSDVADRIESLLPHERP